jgi:SAM-dependent methyltransferase
MRGNANMGLRTALGLKKPKNSTPATLEPLPEHRSLKRAEDSALTRRAVLTLAPKNGVGAELGVFTGAFSNYLYRDTGPAKLYLVDPWHQIFGEFYPDWGAYTDFGKLPTSVALANVRANASKMDDKAQIVVSNAVEWLDSLPRDTLDWVYLDTTHKYQDTMGELEAISRVLKSDGIIMADDCQIDRSHKHHGVFRAFRDFSRGQPFEIIYMDHHKQVAMRRSIE